MDRKISLKSTVEHLEAVLNDANSDPEGQIFLSMPNSHDKLFFLHTFQFSLLLITFKCGKLTNIVKYMRTLFCSCSHTKYAFQHRVVSTSFSAASVNKKVFEFLWLDFNLQD